MLRWIPTRWRRFSLRSLLIALTLVGVAAGVVGTHLRNRLHIHSLRQLITSANCQPWIYESSSRLGALEYHLGMIMPIDAISPEGFVALQQAAKMVDPRRTQHVRYVALRSAHNGQADLQRTQKIIEAFSPPRLVLHRLDPAAATFFLNNCTSGSISVQQRGDWSSTTDIKLNCPVFIYSGGGFSNFWRCVSPESSVKCLEVYASPAELQSIYPIPTLQEVTISTGHMDECDVVQLMSRLQGALVKLECCGIDEEQAIRLRETFAPQLLLQRSDCLHP
ncbi:hypothetical protein [Anatilimnocola floriformis]|uniref:hypothetical protein n=1 Tax=Anatilimnocola floriformis TaxID=2948575 RepID=UPI0020C44434|nr:hypothetical protein [Anatilimnocola floriformis]